jgi:hypothetical protein
MQEPRQRRVLAILSKGHRLVDDDDLELSASSQPPQHMRYQKDQRREQR